MFIEEILRGYSFFGLLQLVIYKCYTILFFPTSRLVRLPIYVKGKYRINFGRNLTTGRFCRIECYGPNGKIDFGKDCQINDSVHIGCTTSITIGDNVLIASRVFIGDHNHGEYSSDYQSSPNEAPALRKINGKNIVIEDNVWIGEGVAILPGVTIGRGAIIGANSVVTKNIPPETIVVGIPAKPIKQFSTLTNRWEDIL